MMYIKNGNPAETAGWRGDEKMTGRKRGLEETATSIVPFAIN